MRSSSSTCLVAAVFLITKINAGADSFFAPLVAPLVTMLDDFLPGLKSNPDQILSDLSGKFAATALNKATRRTEPLQSTYACSAYTCPADFELRPNAGSISCVEPDCGDMCDWSCAHTDVTDDDRLVFRALP